MIFSSFRLIVHRKVQSITGIKDVRAVFTMCSRLNFFLSSHHFPNVKRFCRVCRVFRFCRFCQFYRFCRFCRPLSVLNGTTQSLTPNRPRPELSFDFISNRPIGIMSRRRTNLPTYRPTNLLNLLNCGASTPVPHPCFLPCNPPTADS